MPDITGTGGGDNIDVTNDDGTLNGTPQGTPIDNVRARGGNDTVTVTDSTIANDVRGNGGADDMTVTGSTISGFLHGGGGDDTLSVENSTVGNIRLGNGDDSLDFQSTDVTGSVRGGGGTDSLNLPTGTVVNDNTFGTFTVTSGGGYSLSSGTFTLPSGKIVTYTTFENGTGFPCFNRGTLIETKSGPCPIEDLRVGDMVRTRNGAFRPIRWIGRRAFSSAELRANPKLRPIRICKGALGQGHPKRDLWVSRQHRMLVSSVIAERMFGEPEVLLPAIRLIGCPGVSIDEDIESVEYFHLLLDSHEILFAEGAPSESLLTGPEALRSLGPEALEEIRTIFPDLARRAYDTKPARFIPPGRSQKRLVARHLRNNKPLLSLAAS